MAAVKTTFLGRHRPVLHTAMLNLIYPAVLGSVFYVAFESLVSPLVALVTRSFGLQLAIDPATASPQGLKIGFLVVTVVFYHCDYFYMKFTREFGLGFFVADCIFLAGLYVTLVALNTKSSTAPLVPQAISMAYISFFAAYFLWDGYEFVQGISKREKRYYIIVLVWEFVALATLTLNWLEWPRWFSGTSALLGIVTVATALFIPIVVIKSRFTNKS